MEARLVQRVDADTGLSFDYFWHHLKLQLSKLRIIDTQVLRFKTCMLLLIIIELHLTYISNLLIVFSILVLNELEYHGFFLFP